ncbi:MAG: hypothetical protein R2848_19355 [Thermomicrobiales bacterium]
MQCVKIVNDSTIYSPMRTIPSRALQFHPADQETESLEEELRLHLGRTRHPHRLARNGFFCQTGIARRVKERFLPNSLVQLHSAQENHDRAPFHVMRLASKHN